MTATLRLQYTSVRTRALDGQVLIGIKHTARDATSVPTKTPWIEMTPNDAASLVKTLQETLTQLPVQTATASSVAWAMDRERTGRHHPSIQG